LATISGSANLQNLSDEDMVKLYSFKEKHKAKFTFRLDSSNTTPAPSAVLGWTNLESLELLVHLVKDLQTPKQP
jgi:hypothetical protein